MTTVSCGASPLSVPEPVLIAANDGKALNMLARSGDGSRDSLRSGSGGGGASGVSGRRVRARPTVALPGAARRGSRGSAGRGDFLSDLPRVPLQPDSVRYDGHKAAVPSRAHAQA